MTNEAHNGGKVTPIKRRRCPICGKPTIEAWRPFCSKRCADIDLGRWLGEAYRIPTREEPDEDNTSGRGPPSDAD